MVIKHQRGIPRRKVLIGLGVGLSALCSSTEWMKPVVEIVILPTHAQTSSNNNSPSGTWLLKDTRNGESDPGAILQLNTDNSGIYDGSVGVSWSTSGSAISLSLTFSDSTASLSGTVNASGSSMSGTWTNSGTGAAASWVATKTAGLSRASRLTGVSLKAFR